MGVIKGVMVLIIILLLLSFVMYPDETKNMLKNVGYVVLDFGKERAQDLEQTVEEKINSKLSLPSPLTTESNS